MLLAMSIHHVDCQGYSNRHRILICDQHQRMNKAIDSRPS